MGRGSSATTYRARVPAFADIERRSRRYLAPLLDAARFLSEQP